MINIRKLNLGPKISSAASNPHLPKTQIPSPTITKSSTKKAQNKQKKNTYPTTNPGRASNHGRQDSAFTIKNLRRRQSIAGHSSPKLKPPRRPSYAGRNSSLGSGGNGEEEEEEDGSKGKKKGDEWEG